MPTAAVRQPFLVAALLTVTVGASYATREWITGGFIGTTDLAPIQARPAVSAALAASPVLVEAPRPVSPPRGLDTPPAAVPPPPATKVSSSTATAASTRSRTQAASPRSPRQSPTPARGTAPGGGQVGTASAPQPVAVAAMTAPPPARLSIPPPEGAAPAPAEAAPEPPDKSQVFEVSQVDVRPEVASRTEPSYPASARERGLEDVVVVRVLVSSNGRAADTQILRRSKLDAAFDSAALSAVRQWRFTPARKRDRVVSCWMSVGIPFRMARAEGSQ